MPYKFCGCGLRVAPVPLTIGLLRRRHRPELRRANRRHSIALSKSTIAHPVSESPRHSSLEHIVNSSKRMVCVLLRRNLKAATHLEDCSKPWVVRLQRCTGVDAAVDICALMPSALMQLGAKGEAARETSS